MSSGLPAWRSRGLRTGRVAPTITALGAWASLPLVVGLSVGFLGVGAELLSIGMLIAIHRRDLVARLKYEWRLGIPMRRLPTAIVIGALSGGGAVVLLTLRNSPHRVMPFSAPPAALAALVIVVLAMANAVMEESLWRLLLQGSLTGEGLGGAPAVALPAIGFALSHLGGLPGGPIGMLGAGLFGLAQGILRRKGRSLPELSLIHFVVDLIIFSFVWQTGLVFGHNHFG